MEQQLTFAAESRTKFPLWVSIVRDGDVIHEQRIHSPEAWVPPVPPGCGILLLCNDGTRVFHPPQ